MDRNDHSPIKQWLDRDLVCLLGLPIDVIDLQGAMGRVRQAVQQGQRLFLSTPNLNFLVAAQSDEGFRESVLRSHLSVADGMSLVLLGRIMGANLPERVTGSDLFEQLAKSEDSPPIKVFFFGGPPGAGQRAAERLNRDFKGLQCVGFHEAGFGNVASMSTPDIIDRINDSGAEFVVVALGAKKGQAWILQNQHRLRAPVVSHLGAVINFMAGTVRRSPMWLRRIGLEWVWRIIEEPELWRRYWDDGLVFLSLMVRHVIPAAFAERRARRQTSEAGRVVSDQLTPTGRTLALAGRWGRRDLPALKEILGKHVTHSLRIDMTQVTWLDLKVLGTIAGLHGCLIAEGGQGVELCHVNKLLRKKLQTAGAAYLMPPMAEQLVGAKA